MKPRLHWSSQAQCARVGRQRRTEPMAPTVCLPSSVPVVAQCCCSKHLIRRSQSDQLTWNGLQLKLKQRIFIFTEKLSLWLAVVRCWHSSFAFGGWSTGPGPTPGISWSADHCYWVTQLINIIPRILLDKQKKLLLISRNCSEQAILGTLVDKRSFWAMVWKFWSPCWLEVRHSHRNPTN